MARPTNEGQLATDPEPTPEPRRRSYVVGEPDSTPELVQLISCRSQQELNAIPADVLLVAVQQAKNTIAEWEGVIVDLQESNQTLETQNHELQTQTNEQQGIIRYLEQNRSGTTMTPTPSSTKTPRIPDPEKFAGDQNPAFENWKIQIEGKLELDPFPTEQSKMLYLFGCTTGNAQKALKTRYGNKNPFQTAKEMIEHLANIYLDPYKVENARQQYRTIRMKPTQSFTEFYTEFLQLAGDADIPPPDWRPDLYDKLTFELHRAVIPLYDTFADHQALADKCRRIDQDLKRMKERTDQAKGVKPGLHQNPTARTLPVAKTVASVPKANLPTYADATKTRPIYNSLKK